MPEHVHLLVNEPEQVKLAQAMLAPEIKEVGGEQLLEHSENPAELRSAWTGRRPVPTQSFSPPIRSSSPPFRNARNLRAN